MNFIRHNCDYCIFDRLNYNDDNSYFSLLITVIDWSVSEKEAKLFMALSKQERKEMARKAMEKRGSKKPDGSGFAKIDADAKKLSE